MPTAADFDVILLDVGGVLMLPDPAVLGPLLAYYGGDPSPDVHHRAHYGAMAVRSAAAAGEHDWAEYNASYVRFCGVPEDHVDRAAMAMGHTFNAHLWRHPIAENVSALAALQARGAAVGIVSNASGHIADLLRRSAVCQEGPGPHTPVRVVVDSHDVGVEKPDPKIFAFALDVFDGVARERVAYVGDSVTMDIGGAAAAGLHPVLIDPYDDHPEASFDRIRSLTDLL